MALNIEDQEVEDLAAEVASLSGETETDAVRQSLRERRDRLKSLAGERRRPKGGLLHYLETEIWPQIPEDKRGGPPMTKAEREELLGYGPEGH
jgi:antitoxin VapB